MSSRQYTVTVKLKDDGLLKKLEGVGSSGGGGKAGGTGGVYGGGGDIFRRLETLGVGQLMKLTGIGIGVGSLVALTIKSSAMLQGTFKLWEHGINLILKPIGDFFALALRPVTIALMTQFVIPFYKSVYPFFRDYGKKAGEALIQQGTDIRNLSESIGKGLMGFTGGAMQFKFEVETKVKAAFDGFSKLLTSNLSGVPAGIVSTFTTLGTSLQTAFTSIPSAIVGRFTELGTYLTNSFTYIPKVFVDTFFNTATNLWNGLMSIPGAIVDVFTGLIGGISSALSGIPSAIYNAIMGWISQLTGGVLGGGGPAPDTGSRFQNGNIRQRTNMAGVADTARS